MYEGMLAQERQLDVRVKLTLATGAVIELDGGDVVSFSVAEGSDAALLPGSVLSARLTLLLRNDAGQWRWGGSLRGERPLIGATAEVFLLKDGGRMPCGAFIIDSVSAQERSGTAELSGSDSIASELAVTFRDGLHYPATLAGAWAHLVSQTRYTFAGSVPNGSAVINSAPEWGVVTLRKAAGWIAQAAGCFVRVNRSGKLELVKCTGGAAEEIGPDAYWKLQDGFSAFGPVEAIKVTPLKSKESFTVSAGGGTGETVSVEGNPLFIEGAQNMRGLAAGMLEQLQGLTLAKAAFSWRGDPSVGVGQRIRLTDTYGSRLECTVTRQTMTFDGGFSAECVCAVPDAGDGGMVRAITPEGGVNANALVGTVDGGLLAAESVTAKSIAARAVTAEKLAAGSVSADHLAAGSVSANQLAAGAVTADKLEAGSVSAKTAEFMAAEIGKLTAADVNANGLYASFAHLFDLAAGSISAGNVDADRLAAALSEFVSLYAGVGEFDFATIQNLVAKALSLEQASAESVYIKNLAVTTANLLSATLGKLVLKGDDGKYYRVFVGADGNISTERVELTGSEIQNGQTSGGQQIVETGMNVANLNATNLQASSAVINQILTTALTAEKITAADALIASATIPTLYTTSIQAIGAGIDLSSNQYITSIVEAVDNAQATADNATILQSEIAPEDPSDGVLWLDLSASPSILRRWSGEAWEDVSPTDGLWQEVSLSRSEIRQLTGEIALKVNKGDLETYMQLTQEGVIVGRNDSAYRVYIENGGYHVQQYGEKIMSLYKRTAYIPYMRYGTMEKSSYIADTISADGGIMTVRIDN